MHLRILFANPSHNANSVTEFDFPWRANANANFVLLILRIGTCLPHAGRYVRSRTGAVTQVSILPQSFFCYCRITFLLLPHHFFCFCRIIFSCAVQTAMKRSPHPAGRALRTQRKFVALAWSRVTPHPPPLRYALRGNIYCQYGSKNKTVQCSRSGSHWYMVD